MFNILVYSLLALFIFSFFIPYLIPIFIGILVISYLYSKLPSKIETNKNLDLFLYTKKQYLRSPQWKEKRRLVIARDKHCQVCGSYHNLAVHHLKDYKLIPNEPISSLVLLCHSCHNMQHEKLGYPKTYQEYMDWNVKLIKDK